MGTGTKLAVGCGCLLLLGLVGGVAVLGLGAWWARGKLTEARGGLDAVVARAEELDRWTKRANAHPYAPPEGGVVPEPRFAKFLETRKRVHAVYERREPDLRELLRRVESGRVALTPADLWSAGGTLADAAAQIRLEQMKALAEEGMCEGEYRDIQLAVYKAALAAAAEAKSGRLPAEALPESVEAVAGGADEAARRGLEAARREGVPGSGMVSEEDVKKLRDALTRLGREAGGALEVPRANVDLYRGHEADIRKYAMHPLAYLGL
jgi:hypothetical protein